MNSRLARVIRALLLEILTVALAAGAAIWVCDFVFGVDAGWRCLVGVLAWRLADATMAKTYLSAQVTGRLCR